MDQSLGLIALVVRDYDEALAFFVGKLGFELVEDRLIPEEGKRWVVVRPPGSGAGAQLLLARASTPEQRAQVEQRRGEMRERMGERGEGRRGGRRQR